MNNESNGDVSNAITAKKSNAWYLLPIFLGIIGGIIAYFVLRNSDSRKARNCLIVGFIILGLGIVFLAYVGSTVTDEGREIIDAERERENLQEEIKKLQEEKLAAENENEALQEEIEKTKSEEERMKQAEIDAELERQSRELIKSSQEKFKGLSGESATDNDKFDPAIVTEAEKSIPAFQNLFREVLRMCNNVDSYSDYVVFLAVVSMSEDEFTKTVNDIDGILLILELSGYDEHPTVGPLISETRQLAGEAGDCMIDLLDRYDN